jgi:hypothetical protein
MEDIEVFVPCSRCGGMLPVSTQMIDNMRAEGTALTFAHAAGQCPGEQTEPSEEEAPPRRFRLQLVVSEVGDGYDEARGDLMVAALKTIPGVLDVMGGAGHTFEARNVGEAVVGPMTVWLNEAWPKVQDEMMIGDLPAAPSLVYSEPQHTGAVTLIVPGR